MESLYKKVTIYYLNTILAFNNNSFYSIKDYRHMAVLLK